MLQTELLLTALARAKATFVVVGGMAAVAQGSAYLTADLDICYERNSANYDRITAALRPFKPRLRGVPGDLPFVLDATTLKSGLNFTLTTQAGDIDLLGELTGFGDYEAVKAFAEEIELYQQRIWVLTLEGLIRSKEATGRPKDLRLLPELKALQALRDLSGKGKP